MNKILKNSTLIYIIFLAVSISYGQELLSEVKTVGKIYGQVINKNTEKPVEFASVALYSLMDSSAVFGTLSNANGDFIIKEVPIGLYNLEISFVGFKKTRINRIIISPKEFEIFFGEIEIEPTTFNLEEVFITAERSQFEYKSDKKVINIEQDISVKSGSLVDALESMPSIKTDMEGNLTLRGSSNYTVLINGRPSVLKGSDALQQIPANNVKSVEIITNPSAKYDPEGEVGIINVITKKSFSEGLTGILNGSYGSLNRYSSETVLNYKFGKFGVNGSININENPIEGNASRYSEIEVNDTVTSRDADMDMSINRKRVNARIGLNYTPNERNYLNIETTLGEQTFERNAYSEIINYSDSVDYLIADSKNNRNIRFYSSTLDYQHLFNLAGHKLDATLFYSFSDLTHDDLLSEDFADRNWQYISRSINQKTDENGNYNELRLNVDYVKPLESNNKLETGYQGKIKSHNLDQNFFRDEFNATDTLTSTGEIEVNRNTQALYGLYSDEISDFSFKLGLRLESTQREVKQIADNSSFDFESIDIFPSFHLSYSLNRQNQFQLSYSRRINRPSISQLNPYKQYIDNNNFREGNPQLEPEYVNSFELNYAKRFFMSFVSVELFYRETINKMSPVWYPQEDGSLFTSYENFDKDNAFGMELMTNLNLIDCWSLMLSTSLYKYNIQGDDLGYEVSNSSNSWNIRFGSRFKITQYGTKFQINGIYNGSKASAQGSRDGFFVAILGVNQDIIKNKLTVSLQIRDVFSTMKFETYSESEYFTNNLSFTPSTPLFAFSLNFKFNNYKESSRKLEDINEFDFEESIY